MDVKVISSEECVPQYRIVIGRLVIPMKLQKKNIVKFVPKPRVWKLKDEDVNLYTTYIIICPANILMCRTLLNIYMNLQLI